MCKQILLWTIMMFSLVFSSFGQTTFEVDTFQTSEGDLTITFIGHGTLMFEFKNNIIHIDPVSQYADFSELPKADIILITHEHGDHLDRKTIQTITKNKTILVLTEKCTEESSDGIIMKNGEVKTINGMMIEAVPAYNIIHKRRNGQPYHPKGNGNGYVITFGDKRVYIAGDTENTQEMKTLKDIDIAFLPMNIPYTMTPEMVADAANAFRPNILYPYHYGRTDPSKLIDLMKNIEDIEIRIREMQ